MRIYRQQTALKHVDIMTRNAGDLTLSLCTPANNDSVRKFMRSVACRDKQPSAATVISRLHMQGESGEDLVREDFRTEARKKRVQVVMISTLKSRRRVRKRSQAGMANAGANVVPANPWLVDLNLKISCSHRIWFCE